MLIPPEGGELGAILNFWFTYNHDSNSMQLEVWPHFRSFQKKSLAPLLYF